MKIVLLNGLMASGKTTVGKMLAEKLTSNQNEIATFIDMDNEVERINGSHEFPTPEKKLEVWLEARRNVAKKTNENSTEGITSIIVGPFFQKDEISGFIKYLDPRSEVYLYTLTTPLDIRLERNRGRQWPNPEEEMHSQHKAFESDTEYFGINIENKGTTHEVVGKILQATKEGAGRINISDFAI